MRLRTRHKPTVPIRRQTMKVKEAFGEFIDENGNCTLTDEQKWDIALSSDTPDREGFEDVEDGYPF